MDDYSRLRWFGVMLLAVFVCGTGAQADPPTTDQAFTSSEKRLAKRLFAFQRLDPRAVTPTLEPFFYSTLGMKPGDSYYEHYRKMEQMFHAHHDLIATDDEYAERFREVEGELVKMLGDLTSLKSGRQAAYPRLLAAGIYHELFEATGRSFTADVPGSDVWGSDTQPFVRGSYPKEVENFPRSVLMFRYCSGMAEQNDHGLTMSALPDDPYLSAHQALSKTEDYRNVFQSAVQEAVAEAAPPTTGRRSHDVKTSWEVTSELRRILMRHNVHQKLERWVDERCGAGIMMGKCKESSLGPP